jgi:hypothetical protein
MANLTDKPAGDNLPAPWQNLLATVEKNAAIISNEVINDAVLGRSVTAAVSPYFAQADATTFLRDKFADADTACREARAKAEVVMRAFGLPDEWDLADLKAADEQLWGVLARAIGDAEALNRKRAQAKTLERELLDNAIDVIDTCSGIAALRHIGEFRCEGDAFCTAYVAALSIAENMVGRSMRAKGMKVLTDFVKLSLGLKEPYRTCDIYFNSKTAFGIGRTVGIDNTGALSAALMLAIKKNAATPSQLRPHIPATGDGRIGNLSDRNR